MLTDYHEQIKVWAANCPENFRSRSTLVRAEIARIENRDLDAIHLYERAVNFAREDGFVHHEAIASEVAGRFYLSRGLETNAYAHLANAIVCFSRWRADGKVAQLQSIYPRLAIQDRGDAAASLRQLDVSTVIKASQTVSSEIVLPNLIEKLMAIALRNAGADRGLLLLLQNDGYRIEAEARASDDGVAVSQQATATQSLPDTIIRYVLRTQKPVILDDASKPGLFAGDEYLHRQQARSLLCLPLLRQGTLSGLLYIENTLTTHAFTPGRTAVLEILAAQAAISLENTRLYADLQEREAKVRRLVDSNIIGIFIWEANGRIIEANEAFLRVVGYDREDLASDRLRWTDLTPPEWLDLDVQRWMPELKTTRSLQPFEKEYFRKDGSRVPVLIGLATFEDSGNQGVAFVLDLTERKRAESEIRKSERRYHEVQMELAHANRVATMGHLTASIAHEVNQPIGAAITYANAALNWLRPDPPNLEEARRALGIIVEAGIRAGEVVDRTRALVKKAPPRNARVDLNAAMLEIVGLTRGEMAKKGISVQMHPTEGLPLVQGDRVQLQQVMLNLLVNAMEAMSGLSEGPRELLISTRPSGSEEVLFAVQDSGPGLAPQSVDRLFESFYTTKPDGLGMGLSICRSIIEAHQGRLWASANSPRGAVFQFTLPTYYVRSRSIGGHG